MNDFCTCPRCPCCGKRLPTQFPQVFPYYDGTYGQPVTCTAPDSASKPVAPDNGNPQKE